MSVKNIDTIVVWRA